MSKEHCPDNSLSELNTSHDTVAQNTSEQNDSAQNTSKQDTTAQNIPEQNAPEQDTPELNTGAQSASAKKASFFAKPYIPIITLPLAAILITGIVFLITTEHYYLVGMLQLQNPMMFLLNLLPVALVLLLLYFASGKVLFAASATAILFVFFAIVDAVKVSMRQEALLPTDLTLVKETLAIVKTFPPMSIFLIGLLLVLFAVVLVLTYIFPRNSKKPNWRIRITGFALVLMCAFGANQHWYADKELYDGFPTLGNPFFQVNQYNTKGMIYSFLHQYNITQMKAPEGYNASSFTRLENNIDRIPQKNADYPHIIMIMSEAYSDMSKNEQISFRRSTNPMQEFNAICNDSNTVSGKITVANFGGGTSNTEYDVLTGCGTRYLDNPLPSYNFILKPFEGIPRLLKQVGYETVSIHPGNAWFYNRQNVYPNLGFDTSYFLEDSFNLETDGISGYISEVATFDKIIETLDTHIQEKDSPLFSFTVTIQNHGPYERKYGNNRLNFNTTADLTEEETDLLAQYFKGIKDADDQIARLREYAENSDEPIAVVYFGDHLPGFTNGMEFFDLLDYPIDANGTPEEQLAVYETPFFIWQNDAARALQDAPAKAEAMGLPEKISAQFLGSTMLELLDIDVASPMHDLNNALRKELPVCAEPYYVDAEGNHINTLTKEQQSAIELLKGWQYYKLTDQQVKTE